MAGVDTGTLAFIAFGPAMEELMKVLFVMILVETRPYLLRFGWSIWAATLSAALGFAAIENVLYTQVYFPDMPPEVVAFRWTACTALHVSATALATVGVAKMWRRTMRELRPAAMAVMLPWLAAAIVLHGAFNAFAIGAGLLMQG